MSKATKLEEIRVIVELDRWDLCNRGTDELDRIAVDIAASVKRHVDDIGQVYVDRKFADRCSFCERFWEEADDGAPCCCNAALAEWEKAKAGI